LWADNKNCDAERTKDFGGLQNVAFYSTLLSGDICALLPLIDRGTMFSLSVKLIEADRLSNPNGKMDTEALAGGISVGEHGEPTSYHFNKYHPGGLAMRNEWVEVPAYGKESGRLNVIHLAERIRPDQRRGVPILAPVMESLKILQEYTTAELEAALVSGLFTTFIKTESGEIPDPLYNDDDEDDRTMELAPGLVVGLKEGESIDTANPGRPNQAFDPFVMSVIKQIGAALQIPFELLIKHFSSSYSASRAALLESWKAFKTRRQWFAKNFCQPIYEAWLYEAVLTGYVIAPGFLESETIRVAYCTALWNGPTPGMLDPTKETQAALMRVEAGFSTRTKEAAEMNGTDFEANTRVAKIENELIKEAGLKQIENVNGELTNE
jgi:lambda family phage portal protein